LPHITAEDQRPAREIFEHVLSVGVMKSIDLSASLGFVPVPGLGFHDLSNKSGIMRRFLALCLGLLATSPVSGRETFSNIARKLFPDFRAKSADAARKTLVELGIHLTDSSKIVNITDSNWETYLGRQSYGEWLVEFTAKPEHCASCEIIDLAFNGHPSPKDRLANG